MPEQREKLARCFSAVFPALSPQEIAGASPETVEAWDSLASLALLQVIEEEFGVRIDPFELADLAAFDLLLARLEQSG